MGLKDAMKNLAKKGSKAGYVSGSSFPYGTYVNTINSYIDKQYKDDDCMIFTYPNGTEEKITHDMVKCATVLAMGYTGIDFTTEKNNNSSMGVKYLCVLKDGRQAVLTIVAGPCADDVERVLF